MAKDSSDKEAIKSQIDKLRNFGFTNETTIDDIGINGKMNEFSSAIGLLQLKYMREIKQKRKEAETIQSQLRKDELLIALAEEGKAFSSISMSKATLFLASFSVLTSTLAPYLP